MRSCIRFETSFILTFSVVPCPWNNHGNLLLMTAPLSCSDSTLANSCRAMMAGNPSRLLFSSEPQKLPVCWIAACRRGQPPSSLHLQRLLVWTTPCPPHHPWTVVIWGALEYYLLLLHCFSLANHSLCFV